MAHERRFVELMHLKVNLDMQTEPQLAINFGRAIDNTGSAIIVLACAVSGTFVLVGIGLFLRYVILRSSLYPANNTLKILFLSESSALQLVEISLPTYSRRKITQVARHWH